jgi:hypothetical protein
MVNLPIDAATNGAAGNRRNARVGVLATIAAFRRVEANHLTSMLAP